MMPAHKVRLQVEVLEERLPLNADVPEAPVEPDGGSGGTEIIDPTADPADPANATTTGQVTAVETTSSGEVISITLAGLDPANVGAATTIAVNVNDDVYQVDFTVAENNGQFTLYFTGAAGPNVSVGQEVVVVFGDGGDSADPLDDGDPAETETPPDEPPIDPTGDPAT